MTRFGFAALIAFGSSACLGSASETPWPPEPADVDLGPAGEVELSKVPGTRASSSAVAPAGTAAPSARPTSTTTINPGAF